MISKEELLGLADLARLTLDNEEAEALQKDISNILKYVGRIATDTKISTEDTISPSVNLSCTLRNVMRDDTPRAESDPLWGKEEALRAAFPKREGDLNVVRKIIQKDE